MSDVIKFNVEPNGDLVVKKLSTQQDVLEFYLYQQVEDLVKRDGLYKPDMIDFTEMVMTNELNKFFKTNGFDFILSVKFKTETAIEICEQNTNMLLKMDLQIH